MDLDSRISIEQHADQNIQVVDYSQLNAGQIQDLFERSKEAIKKHSETSVNLLEVVSNVQLEPELLTSLNEYVALIRPYIRKYAVIGGAPSILVNEFETADFTIKYCNSKQQGIDYLLT